MKKIFEKHITQELQLSPQSKILLAISGGADSIVMLDLFAKLGYKCCIAHCNFHLRGEESDGDEKLVEKLAEKYNYPLFKVDFDTKGFAEANGISIEMAARDLRYEWFDEIRQSNECQYIATAHHQDDIIETFFINLLRGTGIRGLSGIKPKSGAIIRPLLFVNRSAIMDYINNEQLEYRDDSTNSDIKIIRNKLRHQILPMFDEINLSAKENIIKTIENLQESENLVEKEIESAKLKLGIKDGNNLKLNIEQLKHFKPVKAYIFEFLRPFGFNRNQVKDIENVLDSISGKIFYSKTHQILKDRNELIISLIEKPSTFQTSITNADETVYLPEGRKLIVQQLKRTADYQIPVEQNTAAINLDKLKFPLLIREWEQGDTFFPLGMKQKKKLSDFFIDKKLSLIDKQNILLLMSDDQIVWIIGHRIDDRFKISGKTENILLLELV